MNRIPLYTLLLTLMAHNYAAPMITKEQTKQTETKKNAEAALRFKKAVKRVVEQVQLKQLKKDKVALKFRTIAYQAIADAKKQELKKLKKTNKEELDRLTESAIEPWQNWEKNNLPNPKELLIPTKLQYPLALITEACNFGYDGKLALCELLDDLASKKPVLKKDYNNTFSIPNIPLIVEPRTTIDLKLEKQIEKSLEPWKNWEKNKLPDPLTITCYFPTTWFMLFASEKGPFLNRTDMCVTLNKLHFLKKGQGTVSNVSSTINNVTNTENSTSSAFSTVRNRFTLFTNSAEKKKDKEHKA